MKSVGKRNFALHVAKNYIENSGLKFLIFVYPLIRNIAFQVINYR